MGRLTVVVNAHKEVCAVQKLDGVPLSPSMVSASPSAAHLLRLQCAAALPPLPEDERVTDTDQCVLGRRCCGAFALQPARWRSSPRNCERRWMRMRCAGVLYYGNLHHVTVIAAPAQQAAGSCVLDCAGGKMPSVDKQVHFTSERSYVLLLPADVCDCSLPGGTHPAAHSAAHPGCCNRCNRGRGCRCAVKAVPKL